MLEGYLPRVMFHQLYQCIKNMNGCPFPGNPGPVGPRGEEGIRGGEVQGYLAHKKTPTPLGPP